MPTIKPKIIVIAGPTAVGKTATSIQLAKAFSGEIVNADSMQIYEGLTIGTASPAPEEKGEAPHHLFNYHALTVPSTLSEFLSVARDTIKDIQSRGKLPIVVGGSGLYLESLLFDFQLGQDAPHPEFRERMQKLAKEEGVLSLHQKLATVDPLSAKKIHPNNVRRVIRALEVATFTDHKLSDQAEDRHTQPPVYNHYLIVLTTERQRLYQRIDTRVDKMMAEGLLEEAEWLFNQDLDPNHQSLQAIGYKELFPYLEGKKTLDECVETLKTHSRRYAKRQLTWLRNRLPSGHSYDLVNQPEELSQLIQDVSDFLARAREEEN